MVTVICIPSLNDKSRFITPPQKTAVQKLKKYLHVCPTADVYLTSATAVCCPMRAAIASITELLSLIHI